MAKFSELAVRYATRIRSSIGADHFSTATRITARDVRLSQTLAVLKEIDREINRLVSSDTNRLLTPSQRRSIYEGIAKELGLLDLTIGESLVKAASNDEITDLIDYIDQIIGE